MGSPKTPTALGTVLSFLCPRSGHLIKPDFWFRTPPISTHALLLAPKPQTQVKPPDMQKLGRIHRNRETKRLMHLHHPRAALSAIARDLTALLLFLLLVLLLLRFLEVAFGHAAAVLFM